MTSPSLPKMTFNTQRGELKVKELPHLADMIHSVDSTDGGCFNAGFGNEWIEISPTSGAKGDVKVKTMHLSRISDTYQPSYDYGGVIIYQYDGKSEWRTANNTHCKTGYIVIQNTDSEVVKKWENEPGIVHGAIYRNAFGESVKKTVIGEGFAIRSGKIEINSGVFNNPSESYYHDDRKRMHELSEHCIKKIVEYWKNAGPCWSRKRTFDVKELLHDFDLRNCTWEAIRNKRPRT